MALGALLLGAAAVHGQQAGVPSAATPAQSPQVKPPAGPVPPDAMQIDWPNLKRFRDKDAALPAPTPSRPRVVFMGDSITESWNGNGVPSLQPDSPWEMINRGISGQTTPQMLLRFRQDVLDLKPSAVVLLAGTNDIAGNTGEITNEQIEENLASMADQAHAAGIRVVLCSILPAFDYPWKPGRNPVPRIAAVNAWLKDYASSHGYVYVDFFSAMADDRNGLPPAISKDGVHPNPAGYARMTPLVEAGIAKALARN